MPKRSEETGVQYIWVQASPSLRGRVALWEPHPAHPKGQAYVAGDGAFQVARTGEVLKRLSIGTLIEVSPPKAAESPAPEPSPAPVVSAESAPPTAGASEPPARKGTGAERPSQKTP